VARGLLVVVLLAGCRSPTLLLVDVSASVPLAAMSVTVNLAGSDAGVTQAVPSNGRSPTPGTVAVELPDIDADVTVEVQARTTDGTLLAAEGAAHVTPHARSTLALSLGPTLGDGGQPSLCGSGRGADSCAGASYLFCDGFEHATGSTFPGWPIEDVTTGGAVLATDGTGVTPCLGGRVFESTTTGIGQIATIAAPIALPRTVYLRTYVYMKSEWAIPYAGLIAFSTPSWDMDIHLDPTRGQLRVARSFGLKLGPFRGFLPGAWACVEWSITFDTTAGSFALWIDGEQTAAASGVQTTPDGSLPTSLQLGVIEAPNATAVPSDFLFDEVAVSTSRIGCF
jgi:hypothetical protein